MSGGSSATPVVQTASKEPWSGAVPDLTQIMGSAAGLYGADVGYHPWTGGTVAPIDPTLQQGLGGIQSLAQSQLGGTAGVLAGQKLATNVINQQGITPGIQSAIGNINQIAGQVSGQQNPYLQGAIDQQMDKVNAAMSGAGRYGSGAHDAAVAQAISPLLAQDYMQRQQLGLGAYGQVADIYSRGLGQAGQYAQMVPGLDQAQYMPAQMLTNVGQYNQQRAQQALSDQINLYNMGQSRDWEQLARYNAIVGGAGQLGGNQITSTQPSQASLGQRLLGGALAGGGLGSAFAPGIGTGIGALGGAAAGAYL